MIKIQKLFIGAIFIVLSFVSVQLNAQNVLPKPNPPRLVTDKRVY